VQLSPIPVFPVFLRIPPATFGIGLLQIRNLFVDVFDLWERALYFFEPAFGVFVGFYVLRVFLAEPLREKPGFLILFINEFSPVIIRNAFPKIRQLLDPFLGRVHCVLQFSHIAAALLPQGQDAFGTPVLLHKFKVIGVYGLWSFPSFPAFQVVADNLDSLKQTAI
jgi:hypothetical protein